jgi:hypothetical protein
MVLTLHLCVLYSSQKKRRLLLYTLTDLLYITEVESVYCAVSTESLYIKQRGFVFKGLQIYLKLISSCLSVPRSS